jgi:hypothetical protein
VENNRFVLLEAKSYVDDILDWEKGVNGGVPKWMLLYLLVKVSVIYSVSHSPSFNVERLSIEDTP